MATRLANALLSAAVVAAGAVLAQPEPRSTDPAQQLLGQIAALRAEGGPTAAGLLERLHILALLYQETGDHAAASAALEEARYITRVNQGLSSIEEALLLRQQIRSEAALRRYERAWNLEQDMVTIARKHLDNIRIVPVFRDLAEARSEVLRKVRAGEAPPELYLGCYMAGRRPRYEDPRLEQSPQVQGGGNCRFGVRDVAVATLREEIQLYYADAIEVILKNGDYASPELRDLERQALRIGLFAPYRMLPSIGRETPGDPRVVGVRVVCPTETLDELLASDVLDSCLEPVVHAAGDVVANVGSWISLVRLIAYEIRSAAPAADRASAFVELADWHLLSAPADRRELEESTGRALEVYERAYRELERAGGGAQAATQAFSPDLPVTLPADKPNPFASAANRASSRYVDVAFDVTKYGRAERIEILGSSKGATRAEERDLLRSIEGTSFRPRFVEGALADAARVTLRYGLEP